MFLRIDRFEGDGLQTIWIAFAMVDGIQHSHGQRATDILRIDRRRKENRLLKLDPSFVADAAHEGHRLTKWSGAANIARLPYAKGRREHTHLSVPDARIVAEPGGSRRRF